MPTKSTVRVLLVGDRPVVLAGLAAIIDADPAMRVVGEARSTNDALKKIRDTDADVMITCTPLAEGSLAPVVRRVKSAQSKVAVVALAMLEDNKLVEEMIRAGATTCLLPQADRRCIVDALRAAAGKPRPPRRADAVSTAPPNSPLSRRELQVLTLIAEGNTNKQVAEQLGISVRTVETHRERVMRKLNAQGTAALTKWAISLGLVNPRE